MTSTASTPIAVIGATGQQGGAVRAALSQRGAPVRAIIRDDARAGELTGSGVEVAVADLGDRDALRQAFDGVAAVFAMTTMTGPDGTDGEVAHGRAIADAARDAAVPHLVYSSVGGAERDTGIPHFESKWKVEQYLRETGVPAVVLRPTFFMENFTSLFTPRQENGERVLQVPLTPGRPLQMIAVADIGQAAATSLLDPSAIPAGGAVEIAGDERTPEAIAVEFSARLQPLALDDIDDDDARAMFRWFAQPPAYMADFAQTRALVGDVTDLPAFVAGLR